MNNKKTLSELMSELGKKSAAKRKKMGHDSEYYRQLAKKRWDKKNK